MSIAQLISVDVLNGKSTVRLMCCSKEEQVTGARTLNEAMSVLKRLGRHTNCTTWQPMRSTQSKDEEERMSDIAPITMPASALEMRHTDGSRYRLVAINNWSPPRADGRWPLILDVDYTDDDGPLLVAVKIETDTEWHGVSPDDQVLVVPAGQPR
ncbi:hypothetical protein ABZW11_26735 [Nonomuraea sp. NPDC004580]|uniref:hypothetical protein n=1 Tax=Nonomuraea sp. NPDC004580 TaxID=3154552 RepID=UPI0033AECE7D